MSPEKGHEDGQRAGGENRLREFGLFRREGSEKTSLQPASTERGPTGKLGRDSFSGGVVIGQGVMALK